MLKRIGVLTLLVAGCSIGPVSFQGPVPPTIPDAYACAVQQLNVLGYTIQAGDRSAGFVRASKQTSGLGTALLTGGTYHDVLTASVFENSATGEAVLRVTVAQVEERAVGLFGGNQRQIKPSDAGRADAHELLAACGVEAVSGSGSASATPEDTASPRRSIDDSRS